MTLPNRTHLVFVGSRFLTSLLEGAFNLLIFIFCKELHALPLQLTLLVSTKPIIALFAFYGALIIKGRPERLRSYLIGACMLGSLPCLFFPFFNSPWYFLVANACFMLSIRATVPAWTEVLKVNLPLKEGASIFSQGATANYLLTVFIPLLASPWLDLHPETWKWLFFLLASIQVINVTLISFLKLNRKESQYADQPYQINSLHSIVIDPWKKGWALMKENRPFRNFQIVIVLGGAGIVAIQPILPRFFIETLQLSYTQLALATSLCKGIAFVISSPLWAKWISKISIYLLNVYINIFICLFIALILAAHIHLYWVYFAYFAYGIMQAGYELSWNLSGSIFSEKKESTLFSSVNLGILGIRGCIFPFIGQILFAHSNSSAVLIFAECIALTGLIYTFILSRQTKKIIV